MTLIVLVPYMVVWLELTMVLVLCHQSGDAGLSSPIWSKAWPMLLLTLPADEDRVESWYCLTRLSSFDHVSQVREFLLEIVLEALGVI